MARSWPTILVVLLALLLVAATPALAAAAEEHGEKEKADIFLPPRFDLTIWTIVVFGCLLLVLKRFAWKPMLNGLQGREARIHGILQEAQTARDDAQQLRGQLQAEMDKVNEKIREMMDEARRDGQQNKDNLIAEAKAEIQAERDRARRELQTEAAQAKQDLWNQTAQLATLVSAKAISRHLTPEDHRGLVDEAVADLRGAQRTTA
jgi:F-type H+-transporting ATPase subunit b